VVTGAFVEIHVAFDVLFGGDAGVLVFGGGVSLPAELPAFLDELFHHLRVVEHKR